MGDVVDLDDRRPVWIPAVCFCNECGEEFDATVHMNMARSRRIECPECRVHSARIIRRVNSGSPTTLARAREALG